MDKKQIFDLIVNKCACVCGVSADNIKGHNRKADVVDARCLVYRFAIQDCGFTPRDVATLLGRENPKGVRSLLNTYESRCHSFCFRELASFLKGEIDRETRGK